MVESKFTSIGSLREPYQLGYEFLVSCPETKRYSS